jgi:branched-chain amino acid transport system permease protein
MSYFAQILGNGLHNGFLYALLAYSYVLLHQVVPRPNLAHGALFAFSGQVLVMGASLAFNALIFTFASSLAFGFVASTLFCAIIVGVMSLVIVPRFAMRAPNMMIVTTLALAIVLMEAVRIGAEGRDLWLPHVATATVPLGLGARITAVQAYNIAAIAALLLVADGILGLTRAGRAIRAVAQDRVAAGLCGINTDAVLIATSVAAGTMACLGGVAAVLYFGNMSFGAGLSYGLKVLFIAAAGGFSTPRLAALAAFVFGEAEALWDGYLPIMWREPVFYSALAFMLCVRGNQGKLIARL